MPLDGHSYLLAQGWSGKGSGLRQGAIARPLAIPQKKTLSGLGKDRDEAFPFWDHLYTVAAKTIQVKLCKNEDSGSETDSSSTPALIGLARTRTGILSNKRPTLGTPASTSGSTTPSLQPVASSSSTNTTDSRLNLISAAKREAAKKGLYSRFFRGPVLSSDEGPTASNATPAAAIASNDSVPDTASRDESNNAHERSEREHGKKKRKKEKKVMKGKEEKPKRKRKRRKEIDHDDSDKSDDGGQSDRKRKREDVAQEDDAGDVKVEVTQRKGKLDVPQNDLVPTGSNGISTKRQGKESKKRATERKDTAEVDAVAMEGKKQRRKEGKCGTREKSEKQRRKKDRN